VEGHVNFLLIRCHQSSPASSLLTRQSLKTILFHSQPIVTSVTFSISDMWYAQDRLVCHSRLISEDHGRLFTGFTGT